MTAAMRQSAFMSRRLILALLLGVAGCSRVQPEPDLLPIDRFTSDFNAAADQTRVVLLLSPT